MQEESQPPSDDRQSGRWTLIRDIGVLQLKLIVDGLRDLVLVPISLVAGVVSLAKSGRGGGTEFYDLLRLGRKSERWINLFGAADNSPSAEDEDVEFSNADIDGLVSRVESFVIDEYRKGGVTKQAKVGLDKAIDSLHKFAARDIDDRD
ncbi:MAG: hypothetical protein HOI35_05965 [Woeseia sp.]|jgi:hypothetical protein|nr:hypothetical protein [Woeseia sp.]